MIHLIDITYIHCHYDCCWPIGQSPVRMGIRLSALQKGGKLEAGTKLLEMGWTLLSGDVQGDRHQEDVELWLLCATMYQTEAQGT